MLFRPSTSGRIRSHERRGASILAVSTVVVALAIPAHGPAAASTTEVDHTLVFNGVDGQASAGTGVYVIPTGSGAAFTFEAWVFDPVANDTDWRHIVSQGQGGTAFYLGTTKDSQQIRAGDKWVATGVDLPVGRWVHIALAVAAGTENFQTARLYLDGQLEAETNAFGGPTVSVSPFRLGSQIDGPAPDGNQFWNGRIDTVRVWDVERTQAEIAGSLHAALPAGTAGLVAQYLANDGSGTTVTNSAGAGLDLTLSGGVTFESVATTTTVGADTLVTFPRSAITAAGGWTVPSGFSQADVLVVAGGGGGGAGVGGGGGAGGMVAASIAVTPGQVIPVTVGTGGRGATRRTTSDPSGFTAGTGGQDSQVGPSLVATGGGVGASWTDQAAGTGGSGGGGSQVTGTYAGAAGISGQGTDGGNAGSTAHPHPTGGGGGAESSGANGSGSASGDGGAGRSSSITGTAVTYAGGGGGGSHGVWNTSNGTFTSAGTAGAGGSGGGGAGGAATAAGQTVRGADGTAGLGGGGGGAGNNCGSPCQTSIGGRGGSGVAIIRLSLAVASELAVAVQPVADGASGALLTTQPVVHIVDGDGVLIIGDSSTTVTVTVQSGGGTLGGSVTATAVNGVAMFTSLTLSADADVDQVLRFTSSPALTSIDAQAIRVVAGSTDTTTVPPSTGTDGDTGAPPVPNAIPAGDGGKSGVDRWAAVAALVALVTFAGARGRSARTRRI